MPKKLRAMLPHGAILIANMFIVFFLIDRVNTSMNFIDNGLTKGLLLAMCVIVLCDALLPRPKPHRASGAKRAPAPAPVTPAPAPVTPAPAPVTPAPAVHRPKHAARENREADT